MGADEFDAKAELGKKTLVIYQGHHGDKGAARADVVFPGCAYTEKDGLYVNTEGRVQMGKKAVSASGDAREDWKILRALSAALGDALPYDTHMQLLERITKEWSHFNQIDELPQEKMGQFGEKGVLQKKTFTLPIDDYYMTNAICRASETQCRSVVMRFWQVKTGPRQQNRKRGNHDTIHFRARANFSRNLWASC